MQTLQRKPGGGETENLADMEMKEDTNVPVDNLGTTLIFIFLSYIVLVSRCNFDEETSGYISMETRFKMLLFFIFMFIMVIVILIFCCKCCCRKKSPSKNNLHPQPPQHHHPPPAPHGPRRQRRMNMKQRVLLVVGFVCFAYIVSFFVEGGSNKSHKYGHTGKQMMQVV